MDVAGRLAHVSCKALWGLWVEKGPWGLAFVTAGNSVLPKFLSVVSLGREESSRRAVQSSKNQGHYRTLMQNKCA